jgi:programmed cell death 8 (apoptosis-inducing factor)
MTGLRKPYDHQPMFWSNIGKEIQFEAVGILDSKLKTVSVWNGMESSRDEFEKGVVYYLKDRKVCGILLWNTFGKIDKAREIILSKKLISDPSKLIDLLK